MNTIGKILVVMTTALSLGFFAFAGALRSGGADWQGELRTPEVTRDFVIETERGDVEKYTVKHRRSEAVILDKKSNLAQVVLDVRKRLETDANARITGLQPEPPKLEKEIKAISDGIAADKIGVESRLRDVDSRIQQLWKQIEMVGDEFSSLTIQTQDVMKIARERREEGMRLSNQIQLLRNDLYAADEQKQRLEDELDILEVVKKRLLDRQNQLKKQLDISY